MAPRQFKSRIHLLAARKAPVVVILQRKRTKLFHVVAVDTERLRITEGSWFRGKLYPMRCDVSFDGRFMVYLAMGGNGKTWNGICRIPWLTTLMDVENTGTWYGGGYFADRRTLKANNWRMLDNISKSGGTPFTIEPYKSRHGGEDLGVLYERFERDGFKRLGDNWGKHRKLAGSAYRVACIGDDGWGRKPSRQHPQLNMRFTGYLAHGYTFAFCLDQYPGLLDEARWATWDANANLWVAWPGTVCRFTLEDFGRGRPSFSLDVDKFEPPSVESAPIAEAPTRKQ